MKRILTLTVPVIAVVLQVAFVVRATVPSDATPEEMTRTGHLLLNQGEFARARRAFQTAARRLDTPESHYNVARVAFAERDHHRARRDCRPLVRLEESIWGNMCMARAHLAWSRSALAFEELETALAEEPNHFEALLALGDAHRMRGANLESESAYRRAASVDANNALPHQGLGTLYLADDRRVQARTSFLRAAELDPSLPQVLFELGNLSHGSEALDYYQRAVQIRPNFDEAQVALGFVYLASSDNERARTSFQLVLSNNDHNARAHEGLGRVLTLVGEYDQAETSIRRSLEIVSNSQSAAIALAELFRARGDIDGALARYREAANLDRSNPWAMMASAHLALQDERAVLCMGFLSTVLEQHPDLARAHVLFGDALLLRGERGPARQHYEQALSGRGPVMRQYVMQRLGEL